MTRSVHTARYQAFLKELSDARKRAGLTQAEVARKLGCPQSFVSKYESGERRLDVIEFLDVMTAIGMDACRFLRRIRSGKRP